MWFRQSFAILTLLLVILTGACMGEGDQSAALTLQLFDRTFTATADADAYAPSDADIANVIANINVAAVDYGGGSLNSVDEPTGEHDEADRETCNQTQPKDPRVGSDEAYPVQ